MAASPAAADFSYGDIARVAPNTPMVVGRPLAVDKDEGHVAVISGDTRAKQRWVLPAAGR